ncbi:hypothetical protein WJX72_011004 [[Myrmecia] bisecta]|uniref:Uncharacterized protein n=1 Tax=[Myrmecia] bisecta TaxID=41462 RepID=A0AAW1PZE1_9CHLO
MRRSCKHRLPVLLICSLLLVSEGTRLGIALDAHTSSKRAHNAGRDSSASSWSNLQVPKLLERIFVCITFHWNVVKLVYLQQAIENMIAYPTIVVICINTDLPRNLQNVLDVWDLPHVTVCNETRVVDDDNKYALLWEHRAVMAMAATSGQEYGCFIYIEDDTHIPWEAMVSWAFDTESGAKKVH